VWAVEAGPGRGVVASFPIRFVNAVVDQAKVYALGDVVGSSGSKMSVPVAIAKFQLSDHIRMLAVAGSCEEREYFVDKHGLDCLLRKLYEGINVITEDIEGMTYDDWDPTPRTKSLGPPSPRCALHG
jgi:hypothetical protein